ncbi:MAG: tRNA-dihydrouridine synthase family protein, partial [archaeon]
GKVKIKGRLFLAPMSNVTNLPFRLLCKKFGASVVYSEMINADAYLMDSAKTKKRIFFLEEERPIGVQMFGSNEEVLVYAAKKIEKELCPDIMDINIGCPAYDVMKTGAGASLLCSPEKLGNLVKKLSASLNIPLTCKIRILKDDDKTIEIASIIERSGASAISIHGRTARQRYSGKANWEIIGKIKSKLTIPVILNGDVTDELSAKNAFTIGCDAIMVGRAAIGNPLLFSRIITYQASGKILPLTSMEENLLIFKEYIQLCKKYDYINITSIKMQAQNFTKGFKGSKSIREKIAGCKSLYELEALLN